MQRILSQKTGIYRRHGNVKVRHHFWSPETGFGHDYSHASTRLIHFLRWREDGQALLLSEPAGARSGQRPIGGREAHTRFVPLVKNELIETRNVRLRLDPMRERVERKPLADDAFQESDDLEIRLTSSTEQRILAAHSLLTRFFLLPIGPWEFAEIHRPSILLKDERRHWLGVQLKYVPPEVQSVSGDGPRWSPKSDGPMAAFLHGGELWVWEMGKEPRLVWRQGDSLVQAVWHRSGTSLFIADQKEVKALSISDPVQSARSLASFDEIRDLTMLEKELYSAGKREGKDGLWKLSIE